MLDNEAMGRFFSHANMTEIIRNMRLADNRSYDSTFTYPAGGAIEYAKALASEVRVEAIVLEESLIELDLERKVARTPRREIAFERMASRQN